MSGEATKTLYVDGFPASTHRRLRVLVAERGTTMRELLAELVEAEYATAPSRADDAPAVSTTGVRAGGPQRP